MRLSSAEAAIRGAGVSATVDIMPTGAATTTTAAAAAAAAAEVSAAAASPTIEESVALMRLSSAEAAM